MRNNALTVLTIGVGLFLAGCGRGPTSIEKIRHYDTHGIVQGISPDRATIDIQHEDIPDFMPSMTMSFSARDRKEISDLKVGEPISFRMTVTNKELLVDQVTKVQPEDVHLPTQKPVPPPGGAAEVKRLKEGDSLPSFSVSDQDGKPVTLETFRGKPFVLTFIFTRCAVPKFCPLMTSNFAELQNAIKDGPAPLSGTRLLSITLDPAFDTPQILKDYGAFNHTDPAIWKLVTGEPKEIDRLVGAFSIYRQTEGGTLSHGLATALVNPDGTIKKIWRGNGWTPAEIIAEIKQG
jgi:protein SCO1/2